MTEEGPGWGCLLHSASHCLALSSVLPYLCWCGLFLTRVNRYSCGLYCFIDNRWSATNTDGTDGILLSSLHSDLPETVAFLRGGELKSGYDWTRLLWRELVLSTHAPSLSLQQARLVVEWWRHNAGTEERSESQWRHLLVASRYFIILWNNKQSKKRKISSQKLCRIKRPSY